MRSTSRMLAPRGSVGGFTLLELMTAITVLAIVLGVGVPAFNDIIRNNRTAAQTNEFITALSFARSEAARRGMPVTVCAADEGQTECDDTDGWQWGWLVFTDRVGNGDGVLDVGDELLLVSPSVGGGIQLTSDLAFISFGPRGTRISSSGDETVAYEIRHQICKGDNLRRISINRMGRPNLARAQCS